MARRATFPFGLPEFRIPSYGRKSGSLRYPRSRTGESEYDRETRLRQEMQMQIRGEYLAGRGEAGRQREERARMEQELAAEGWELEYDTKARKEIAVTNDAIRRLRKDPRFSEEEKIWGERMLTERILGIPKGMSPPDPNKPRAPEGHEFGMPFMGDDGATYQYVIGSTGQPELKLLQRYEQGPEAAKMKWRLDLAAEQVDKFNAEGNIIGSRNRTSDEINAIMEAAGLGSEEEPEEKQVRLLPLDEQQQMQGQEAPRAQPIQQEATPSPTPVAEPPKELFRSGKEEAFISDMEEKYKGRIKDIPSDVLRELIRAKDIRNERRGEGRGFIEKFKDWAGTGQRRKGFTLER